MRWPQIFLAARLITLNVILPAVIYAALSPQLPALWAIFYSGIPPLADAFLYVLLERRVDAINLVVIIGTILGATFAVISNDPKLMLLKDSIVTAIFAYNRAFNGQTPEDKAKLDAQWNTPEIRQASVILTWVFGLGYLFEAIARIILLYIIDLDTMVYISIAAPFVFTGVMGTWAYWYVKRVHRTMKLARKLVELELRSVISYSACDEIKHRDTNSVDETETL
ncbi:hypothetical protein HDV03_004834 [Kappamyces sp. JEL0829]|nr:hypothetical protein HDV03_004834 [Kappamyces sp. JEL0829]